MFWLIGRDVATHFYEMCLLFGSALDTNPVVPGSKGTHSACNFIRNCHLFLQQVLLPGLDEELLTTCLVKGNVHN
jgi:hypothetical protein